MHEVSLIHGLIELITTSASEHGIKQISLIRLVVGECHGALPKALDFAFQALTRDTICQGAILELEITPGWELYVDYYEGEC
ncbi:hypothetical protein JCM14036_27920 [Desulfotomaculum defluvii]